MHKSSFQCIRIQTFERILKMSNALQLIVGKKIKWKISAPKIVSFYSGSISPALFISSRHNLIYRAIAPFGEDISVKHALIQSVQTITSQDHVAVQCTAMQKFNLLNTRIRNFTTFSCAR